MKRPLVYYVVSMIFGCLSSFVSFESFLSGAVLTASFLVIIFFTLNKRFFLICSMFFVIGVLSYNLYFDLTMPNNAKSIRIIQNKNFYYIGSYNGRKIILRGELKDVVEGNSIKAVGSFSKSPDYSKGIIGEYKVTSYKKNKGDLLDFLYGLKRTAYYDFQQRLGDERAGLIMSLCFGETRHLSQSQINELQKMGVVHAISVSGFHMSIIYKVLESMLGLKLAMVISLVYLIFTGSQAATARAFFMILVLKLSKKLYRNYDGLSSLSFSAMIIILIKPYYVLDIGFSLSYLSTLGIIIYNDKLKRVLYKLPKTLNETLSISLSAQCFSMPYAAITLKNISLGFLLGNFFLLPLYTLVVLIGNCALLVISLKPIFNVLCLILNYVVTAIDGAQYVIAELCPPVSYVDYIGVLGMIFIYISYLFIKSGFHRFKYLPVFVFLVLLIESYNFFPKIQYYNLNYKEGVLISYRNNNFLFTSSKELKDYIRKILPTGVIYKDFENDSRIKVGRGCRITVFRPDRSLKQDFKIEVDAYENRTIITKNPYGKDSISSKDCDIINIETKPGAAGGSGRVNTQTFKVLFNKVYAVYN